MEILELKNTIKEIINSLDELNSRVEMIEERISEIKDKTIEINPTGSNSEKKRLGKKVNRASRTCGSITNDLTFHCIWVPKEDEKEFGAEKVFG